MLRGMKKSIFLCHAALTLLAVIGCTGCATVPYKIGQPIDYIEGYPLPEGEAQIMRGNSWGATDKIIGWVWPGSLLSKLILWNYKVDSHIISGDTENILRDYLALNNLTNVKVRINEYSVRDEWRRTMRNKAINPAWRYTLGFWNWLIYTAFPGRIMGGDNYNPYSNTINLYSDIPAITIHEAGHSKDFAKREYKGTYAFLYSGLPLAIHGISIKVPFFNLYPEALATKDALSYLRSEQGLALQKQGYNVLYPAYGSYIGGDIGEWLIFPWGYAAYAAGVIPGHIVGRIRSATLPDPEDNP